MLTMDYRYYHIRKARLLERMESLPGTPQSLINRLRKDSEIGFVRYLVRALLRESTAFVRRSRLYRSWQTHKVIRMRQRLGLSPSGNTEIAINQIALEVAERMHHKRRYPH